MSVILSEIEEMKLKHKKKNPLKTAQEVAPAEGFSSELNQSCWSVVTYKSVAVSHLTYKEASKWAKELKKKGVSGLCVITDAAAARITEM